MHTAKMLLGLSIAQTILLTYLYSITINKSCELINIMPLASFPFLALNQLVIHFLTLG